MYSKGLLIFKYISFWLKASNGKGHGVHSPFVFDFIQQVLRDIDPAQVEFEKIESKRKDLLSSDEVIEVLKNSCKNVGELSKFSLTDFIWINEWFKS